MSKYRVGQKLKVMVESIDRNGKAHFRVIKESVLSPLLDTTEFFGQFDGCDEMEMIIRKPENDNLFPRNIEDCLVGIQLYGKDMVFGIYGDGSIVDAETGKEVSRDYVEDYFNA